MKGLYNKFHVKRVDGKALPRTAAFLPLRLDEHGHPEETRAAREAALVYARLAGDPKMAADIVRKFKIEHRLAVRPVGGKVLVEPDRAKDVSEGGILLPDAARDKDGAGQVGTVRALGTGALDKRGNVLPFHVKVGDRVIVSKYGGAPLEVGGREFKLFDADEVYALLEEVIG